MKNKLAKLLALLLAAALLTAFCDAPFFICRNKKVAEIQIKSPAPIYRMHCKDG